MSTVKRYVQDRVLGMVPQYELYEQGSEWVRAQDYDTLEQKLTESERYGRQADITIENLERKVAQLEEGLKQSQIDAGCYKKGMEASNERLIQVAAENAALKQAESNLVRNIINDLGDTEFQYARVQTPATDSYLAEVRAQGVEMYAANLDSGADDAERDGYDDAVKFLRSEASAVRLFAAQIRREAAQ